MGDWNSEYQEVIQWMGELGLRDVIQHRHYQEEPPPTCRRSRDSPIDIIFVPERVTCWRGGFLSFDYLEGDHRGIWCDIPIEFLLGYNMPNPTHPGARRLKTKDPRVTKRYLSVLHTLLHQDSIYTKMKALYATAQQHWLPTDMLRYEEIDEKITTAMNTAERQCRKLNMVMVIWSPHYQRACDKITYWQLIKNQMEGKHCNVRKIRSLKKKLKLTVQVNNSVEAENYLSKAIQERKKCKKYASELQLEYRHRLAKAKEEEDNIPAATHIRNLTMQEDTRQLFRRIRHLEKKVTNLSTSRITITMKDGGSKEITNKQLIERHIIKSNECKYHQTEGKGQLQQGQLLKDLGITGTGPKSSQVLDGSYSPPTGTNHATRQFLRTMKKPSHFFKVQPITFSDFCEGWNKAKETTSSNGPHFGHYKAGVTHHQIGPLLYQHSQIPILTGYSPRRHREGIDVMLLKKEQNYNVDNLSTIVLIDSEANMNYKHLGRRAMSAAILQNQIATEQYSRPKRKAIDHAINRRLVMDHQLYLRQPYAMTSCDLKSCYDRINHSSASLALQRIGITPHEIHAMFQTIQQMVHKVRTAFGVSELSYGGEKPNKKWRLPPQGVLQGNGSGPALWSILSSNLFHILRDQGHRNEFRSSIRDLYIELAGFAYVDDTDLIQVDNFLDIVVQNMRNKVKLWNDVVSVTGGILAPDKCWWYLVSFKFHLGKWMACDSDEVYQLWMKDSQGRRTEIKKIPVSTGSNMLGVHIAPDGNNRDHVTALRKKAEQWAGNIKDCRSNRNEIWTALHRTIPFSMGYSLPATTLSRNECTYIMAPIYKSGLSRAGISHTIPSAIRYGPATMGGLGLMDPYVHMGVRQVESLLTNTWLKTPTGILMEIALDDISMEMGLRSPFQSITTLKKGLAYTVKSSWIHHLLTFTIENGIDIEMHTDILMPRREQDITIMEKAMIDINHVPTLKSINKVRMQLQIVWLSDITTADGRCLDKRFIKPGSTLKRNHYQWPLKHSLSTVDWQRWKRWCQQISSYNNGMLTDPLGHWTIPQDQWISTWDCFVTKDRQLLYIRAADGNVWNRHVKQPTRNHRAVRFYRDSLVYQEIQEHLSDIERASYVTAPTYIQLLGLPSEVNWVSSPDTVERAFYHIPTTPSRRNIETRLQDVLRPDFIQITNDIDRIIHDYTEGTVVSVSDGSYYPDSGQAAAAWIIELACRTQWIIGAMTVPGPRSQFSSYRSELTGLLGITISLRLLATCAAPPNHCIIGCDGEAALRALTIKKMDVGTNNSNADIISMITDVWSSYDSTPIPVHIDGHQDQRHTRLSRMEKMNVLMDKVANMVATQCRKRDEEWKIPGIGLRTIKHENT
jgi:hypothetical protein